ncbi:methylenetetrahydrofolate reductase [NAD(P)H] [Tissierella creatinophila]|uniref:Methylenetetrahydrofolate reductase n=1 Tax=Tissierella creatinophila DSM 6911 TaxID=1123403 RepID=A0A1U7M7A0_TISCR|nr:methylenetetrahydrofolate reductase [NAD(P)H] [Tissierella creatinophila]OLS03130.1 5,10-methylenetetrahydrofolate reductase [Tissierella creatinophila DSM 6911]
MKIRDLFNEKEFVYSFEIFPPRHDYPIETVYSTIEELSKLKPDYISVTYGAAGSIANNRTAEIANLIKDKYGIESLAHLTCIGSDKQKIDNVLADLKEKKIDNILALRGDRPEDGSNIDRFEFINSQDIIRYIKENSDFGIAAACYPEGHIESRDKNVDIEVLKRKEEFGTDYFISQLFLDNNYFYDFLDKAEQKGIKAPIQAGIMPVINKRQIEKITSLCGATLPKKFIKIIDKYEHDKDALRDAGIAYALEQIVDLISSGVRGVHLYTMNNPYIAKRINENMDCILSSVRKESKVASLG